MREPALSRTDVLDVCAVMLTRCQLTAHALAVHMGETAPVPAPPARATAEKLTPRLIEALDLCTCADGMCVQDLQRILGIGMQTAFAHLDTLHVFGRITRVKIPGIRAARYFSSPAHALAWRNSHAAAVATADADALAAVAARASEKAAVKAAGIAARQAAKELPKEPEEPLVLSAAKPVQPKKAVDPTPTGEPTNPRGIQPLRAVTPVDTRYFLSPGEPLTGGFSTTRPGINAITGRAWGAMSNPTDYTAAELEQLRVTP